MLTFQEFTEQLRHFLSEDFGYPPDSLRILPLGYMPSSEMERKLIQDTNARYFDRESNTLLGNFMFIDYPAGSEKRDNSEHDHDSDDCDGGDVAVRTFERLHLDGLYEDAQKNGFEAAVTRLRKNRKHAENARKTSILEHMDDYGTIRESLIIRPLNFAAHRTDLCGSIFRRVGDIALVLYFVFDHAPDSYMTGRVPSEAFDQWGMTGDAVIDAALENTERIHPAMLYKAIHTWRRSGMDTSFRELGLLRALKRSITGTRMVALSGRQNPNGAVSLFFPGIAELLYQKIGGPYYVAFVSPDSAVLHSVTAIDVKTAMRSLRETNDSYKGREEILSSHLYRYDGEKLEMLRV